MALNTQPPPNLLAALHSHQTAPQNTTLPTLIALLSQLAHPLASCLPSSPAPADDLLEQALRPHIDVEAVFYFFILLARLESCHDLLDPDRLFSQTHRFCTTVTPKHLFSLAAHLSRLAQAIVHWATHLGQPLRALELIKPLIQSLLPLHILTPFHAPFIKVSLETRVFDYALELSNHDILQVDQKRAPVTYQDHLSYHYFAGIIQSLHKNYDRAIHLLTIAVSAPGSSISHIQIDAYKKLILISILSTSQSPVLPKYTQPQLRLAFRNHGGKPYTELMDLYERAQEPRGEGYANLCSVVEQNMAKFEEDQNSDLVKLCLESLPKRMILRLIPVYESLPVSMLDCLLPNLAPGSAEGLIEEMIRSGELRAELVQRGGANSSKELTIFDDQTTELELGAMRTEFLKTIERAKANEKLLKSISNEIETDREFLSRVVGELKELDEQNLTPHSTSNLFHNHASNETLMDTTLPMTDGIVLEEDLTGDMSMGWDDQSSFK